MFKVLLILLLLSVALCEEYNGPELSIPLGAIRGKYMQTRKGQKFSAFMGIPYAKPPVGDLRFKAPSPAEPWEGNLDASKSQPQCPQTRQILGEATEVGKEDCLYVNVYTPQTSSNTNDLLPVMIFIHGGGFVSLSGANEDHGPQLLLDKDIVLVTLNYRLGALGFWSTGDAIVPGNNALKDQSLAIKWVKNNIAHFRGDPERLTLFGQSVGGCSVHLQLLSPLNTGLIQKAISQSGTALSPRALIPNSQQLQNSKNLAQLFNCTTDSSKEMVDCLRGLDAYDIVRQQNHFRPSKVDKLSGFRPVIEPDLEGAFLTEHPIVTYISGKAPRIPFMTGHTTNDTPANIPNLFSTPELVDELNSDFNRIAPITLLYEGLVPNTEETTEKIRNFYFKDNQIDDSSKADVMKMSMDRLLLMGEYNAVYFHQKFTQQPVYYYLLGYQASVGFCNNTSYNYGVCHIDDLIHLFKLGAFPEYEPTESDKKVSEIMLELWTNFAKTGNPTPTPSTTVPRWNPVQSEKQEYYFIKSDQDITMIDSPYEERMRFWKNLQIKYQNYYPPRVF